MKKAIGLLEYRSVTRGIVGADTVVKAAGVELLQAATVCPGKFLVLFAGDVGSVQSAMEAGTAAGAGVLIDHFLLANVHEAVFPALSATSLVEPKGALGVIETFTAAAAVVAGDIAVKTAQVDLVEIRLARGLGGKSFVTICGDVGSVAIAVEAASKTLAAEGTLLDKAVLAAPHPDVWGRLV
ncbi:BMC domain protein [Peptococcaceae bacterium CEB3]|nr:BMC domain protein [Peptococcaceae bacterium CEB3]